MSRQKRGIFFKGNPDKNPPEPLEQTTDHDPDPTLHPTLDYPQNEVEGNDDTLTPRDEDSNPYDAGPGKGKKGTLRSADQPDFEFPDAGFEDGYTFRLRRQFREFVRVQLGKTWYRCSDFGLWRYHSNAKRLNGHWNAEPGQPDMFDTTNDGFLDPV